MLWNCFGFLFYIFQIQLVFLIVDTNPEVQACMIFKYLIVYFRANCDWHEKWLIVYVLGYIDFY